MFRIHATLSNHYQKTYLSAAPDCFTAVKALERLLGSILFLRHQKDRALRSERELKGFNPGAIKNHHHRSKHVLHHPAKNLRAGLISNASAIGDLAWRGQL